MKVVQVIVPPKRLKPGGAERVVLNLSRSLQARGHTVIVATTRGRPFTTLVYHHQGLDIRPMRLSGKFNPLAIMALANLVRSEKAQVIHAHLSTATLIAGIVGRLERVPVVATVHGMSHGIYYRLADRLIAVSQAVFQHLTRSGIAPGRIVVVRNGVDAERFVSLASPEQARRALGVPPGGQLIGSVGRLSRAKGHEYLLQAIAGLKKHFPRLKALIVGEGEGLGSLMRRASSLGLGAETTFVGYRQDIELVLAALDVYVQPSVEEGLGLAVLEAMAAGLPVVGTRVGGIPELIEHGRTGLLAEPGNVKSLSDAIGSLLSDGELRARLGATARAHVRACHTWQRVAEQVEQVYDSALRHRGGCCANADTAPARE